MRAKVTWLLASSCFLQLSPTRYPKKGRPSAQKASLHSLLPTSYSWVEIVMLKLLSLS